MVFLTHLEFTRPHRLFEKLSCIDEKSGGRNGISSRFDLPHHRTYRWVYGGSLSFESDLLVIVCKEYVACPP
jgi:hypothetical protein